MTAITVPRNIAMVVNQIIDALAHRPATARALRKNCQLGKIGKRRLATIRRNASCRAMYHRLAANGVMKKPAIRLPEQMTGYMTGARQKPLVHTPLVALGTSLFAPPEPLSEMFKLVGIQTAPLLTWLSAHTPRRAFCLLSRRRQTEYQQLKQTVRYYPGLTMGTQADLDQLPPPDPPPPPPSRSPRSSVDLDAKTKN
jgi:hypothetical protein